MRIWQLDAHRGPITPRCENGGAARPFSTPRHSPRVTPLLMLHWLRLIGVGDVVVVVVAVLAGLLSGRGSVAVCSGPVN